MQQPPWQAAARRQRHPLPLGQVDLLDHTKAAALDRLEGRTGFEGCDSWYWWGLALGWIGLGYITDLGHPWVTAAATFTFGTVHAAVAPRVVSGRRRSRRLSVSADVAPPRVARLVIAGLIVLTGITVVGALAAEADGAGHPVTVASIFVGLLIGLGGPRLLAVIRGRTARAAASS